jgi:hypothetical protein
MARRDKAVPLADAGLDDLFDSGEEPVASGRTRRPWLLAAVVAILALSAVLSVLARAVGLAPPYALIVSVVAGFVLIRTAAVAVREPTWRRANDFVRPPDEPSPAGAADDGMLAAVGAWNRRIEPSLSSSAESRALLARDLGALADERLRLRHNVTRTTDPVRSRALLGDAVWSVLRRNGNITPADVTAVVQRLEAL